MILSRTQALGLGTATGGELQNLMSQAAALRDLHWGTTVTYSRKVFIPLTNMCRNSCGYCTFVKDPSSPAAHLMTPQQVMGVVNDGAKMGCKEVLFSLGEKPELRYPEAKARLANLGYESMSGYLHDMCELVVAKTGMLPHVNTGTLSDEEIVKLKSVSASMGMMLESTSQRLLAKGQAHHRCPDKVPARRLKTLERAGKFDVPFTTGILIGIGETWEERVDSLLAINNLHLQYGHIQEVIVQNFRAKPGTAMANHPEPDLEDMLRTLVVARLLLDPSISLQAPPNLEERFSLYIEAGINDWGGISPLTIDHINPERAWPHIDQIRDTTVEAGYRLGERLAVYPHYQSLPTRYFSPRVAERVAALTQFDRIPAFNCS